MACSVVMMPRLLPVGSLAPRILAAAALLVQLVVLYVPTAPSPTDVQLPPWFDLVVHAAVFGAVALLWLVAFPARARLIAVACALHAPLSEWIQHQFYAHRSGDLRDVIADLLGVGLGIALWFGWRAWRARKPRRAGLGASSGGAAGSSR